jgi:hypothetical protein
VQKSVEEVEKEEVSATRGSGEWRVASGEKEEVDSRKLKVESKDRRTCALAREFVRLTRGAKRPFPPVFFVSAHSKGVTDANFVSADSKELISLLITTVTIEACKC